MTIVLDLSCCFRRLSTPWECLHESLHSSCYRNLTPCENTLWVRVKRHAIHHRIIENILLVEKEVCAVWPICVTIFYSSSDSSICDILRCHCLVLAWIVVGVLVAKLVWRHSCVADRLPVVVRFPASPRGSFKWWPAERQRAPTKKKKSRLWCIDQFYILFWIRLESGTAYCLSWRYLHWFDIEIGFVSLTHAEN